MNIEVIHELFLKSDGVSIDSRSITGNQLFFAIKGEKFNANDYIPNVLENGALKIITDDKNAHQIFPNESILVENVIVALQQLANYHRKYFKVKVLALTGSNGKTTTKELLYSCLSQKYECIATIGNLNNHLGVPLTLLRITADTEIAIVEMGANHVGEIRELCQIAEPDMGLITNIGKAHLEGFGGFEGVIKGKSEMYNYLYENDHLIFADESDPLLISLLPKKCNHVVYDKRKLHILDFNPTLRFEYRHHECQTQLTGKYNQANIMTAIAVSEYFDLEWSEIDRGIASYVPENKRSQIVNYQNSKIILDAYNANPTSMRLSIENALELSHGNLGLILGDMLELGSDSDIEHQSVCEFLDTQENVGAVFIGTQFSELRNQHKGYFFDNVQDFVTQKELVHQIFSYPYILIKGSRGIKLEQILDHLA
ncbi:MAG TPA: UDP-N-acetylmuramoyl-tripeptide--D-alanyl-D-alanine ligase [Saprospiraceae bacterium]|nr:UDP-N-acetylmuramoyl-tripeptide--D-alanyl-D-alanine ligase [Saprospiraceae bacterium]